MTSEESTKKGNTYFYSLKKGNKWLHHSAFGGKLRKNKPIVYLALLLLLTAFLHLITPLAGKLIDKPDQNIKT